METQQQSKIDMDNKTSNIKQKEYTGGKLIEIDDENNNNKDKDKDNDNNKDKDIDQISQISGRGSEFKSQIGENTTSKEEQEDLFSQFCQDQNQSNKIIDQKTAIQANSGIQDINEQQIQNGPPLDSSTLQQQQQ
ncbi:MAG: hypothetical protein EZS28_038742 [Streblomastix strix]|uniref:Uncharacterized protein n=1 Tax=Streblomastix strix TaxID=222440 RepID=A0A5J4U790_9EUKA|nr:MAG: hypothetical protein EZS28_038742 [Streblomastix strix]